MSIRARLVRFRDSERGTIILGVLGLAAFWGVGLMLGIPGHAAEGNWEESVLAWPLAIVGFIALGGLALGGVAFVVSAAYRYLSSRGS